MAISDHTPSVYASQGLWRYQGRNRAITIAVLNGVSPANVSSIHKLPVRRIMLIVRKVLAEARPDLVDAGGFAVAWSLTLTELRAQRGQFGL